MSTSQFVGGVFARFVVTPIDSLDISWLSHSLSDTVAINALNTFPIFKMTADAAKTKTSKLFGSRESSGLFICPPDHGLKSELNKSIATYLFGVLSDGGIKISRTIKWGDQNVIIGGSTDRMPFIALTANELKVYGAARRKADGDGGVSSSKIFANDDADAADADAETKIIYNPYHVVPDANRIPTMSPSGFGAMLFARPIPVTQIGVKSVAKFLTPTNSWSIPLDSGTSLSVYRGDNKNRPDRIDVIGSSDDEKPIAPSNILYVMDAIGTVAVIDVPNHTLHIRRTTTAIANQIYEAIKNARHGIQPQATTAATSAAISSPQLVAIQPISPPQAQLQMHDDDEEEEEEEEEDDNEDEQMEIAVAPPSPVRVTPKIPSPKPPSPQKAPTPPRSPVAVVDDAMMVDDEEEILDPPPPLTYQEPPQVTMAEPLPSYTSSSSSSGPVLKLVPITTPDPPKQPKQPKIKTEHTRVRTKKEDTGRGFASRTAAALLRENDTQSDRTPEQIAADNATKELLKSLSRAASVQAANKRGDTMVINTTALDIEEKKKADQELAQKVKDEKKKAKEAEKEKKAPVKIEETKQEKKARKEKAWNERKVLITAHPELATEKENRKIEKEKNEQATHERMAARRIERAKDEQIATAKREARELRKATAEPKKIPKATLITAQPTEVAATTQTSPRLVPMATPVSAPTSVAAPPITPVLVPM